MRLMYTTALASALLFAGPALAAGDKLEGATGMTAPETSAAQLPGGEAADIQKHFESAGFNGWRDSPDAYLLRMQSAAGQPVWVVLMPDSSQVGAAEPQAMDRDAGELAAAPGSDTAEEPGGGMPQRGERADISETFPGAEGGEEQDSAAARELLPEGGVQGQNLAGAPEIPGPQDQPQGESQLLPEGPPATEVPQGGRELGTAQSEYEEPGQQGDLAGVPEIPGGPEEPRGTDIAQAPEAGVAGETEPEGFAAEIPAQLQSDLEGAGFKQVESVDGAHIFHAKTKDGQSAFIILGDLGGFEGQQ